jgi:Protein of unknown function (DUF3892)
MAQAKGVFIVSDVRITCILKSPPQGGHEHITHAGNSSGTWPVELIIGNIERRIDTFFVNDRTGKRAEVGVVRAAGKRPYIRTHADGYYNDNLLSLTACPWRAAA